MSHPTLFSQLEITSEKNILIQGLPSSIEKQFIKLSYSKNVTPLLRIKRIDFAMVFAVNANQLRNIMNEVIPHLSENGKLWVACPKPTSKIVSDLTRECNWDILAHNNFQLANQITLDNVWSASRFQRIAGATTLVSTPIENKKIELKGVDFDKNLIVPPAALEKILTRHKKARDLFQNLSVINQKEYVQWIEGAKREDTKNRRSEATVEKLLAGKKNPSEK